MLPPSTAFNAFDFKSPLTVTGTPAVTVTESPASPTVTVPHAVLGLIYLLLLHS
jgi:hypothetical protein